MAREQQEEEERLASQEAECLKRALEESELDLSSSRKARETVMEEVSSEDEEEKQFWLALRLSLLTRRPRP